MENLFARAGGYQEENLFVGMLVSMNDLMMQGRLPALVPERHNVLTILIVGATPKFEVDIRFENLYYKLKNSLYPDMEGLRVFLCGSQISDGVQQWGSETFDGRPANSPLFTTATGYSTFLGTVTVNSPSKFASTDSFPVTGNLSSFHAGAGTSPIRTTMGHTAAADSPVRVIGISRRFETLAPDVVSDRATIAFMIAPNLTRQLSTWTPAVHKLADANIPTAIIYYADAGRTADTAMQDADTLQRFFGASVLPPAAVDLPTAGRPRMYWKSATYLIFQGKTGAAQMSTRELRIQMCVEYLNQQAQYQESQHPSYSEACRNIAFELENSIIPFTNQTREQLSKMANIRCGDMYHNQKSEEANWKGGK